MRTFRTVNKKPLPLATLNTPWCNRWPNSFVSTIQRRFYMRLRQQQQQVLCHCQRRSPLEQLRTIPTQTRRIVNAENRFRRVTTTTITFELLRSPTRSNPIDERPIRPYWKVVNCWDNTNYRDPYRSIYVNNRPTIDQWIIVSAFVHWSPRLSFLVQVLSRRVSVTHPRLRLRLLRPVLRRVKVRENRVRSNLSMSMFVSRRSSCLWSALGSTIGLSVISTLSLLCLSSMKLSPTTATNSFFSLMSGIGSSWSAWSRIALKSMWRKIFKSPVMCRRRSVKLIPPKMMWNKSNRWSAEERRWTSMKSVSISFAKWSSTKKVKRFWQVPWPRPSTKPNVTLKLVWPAGVLHVWNIRRSSSFSAIPIKWNKTSSNACSVPVPCIKVHRFKPISNASSTPQRQAWTMPSMVSVVDISIICTVLLLFNYENGPSDGGLAYHFWLFLQYFRCTAYR